jgi:methionyl-tRNA formyltransferase
MKSIHLKLSEHDMKILYCGYRTWALDAHSDIVGLNLTGRNVLLPSGCCSTQEQLLECINNEKFDAIFMAGWSWIIPKKICDDNYIVDVHPSDLPEYAGGTPIQHQVIDGLTKTNATLFNVTSKLDGGPIIFKVPISLKGGIDDIFKELTRATVELYVRFTSAWPHIIEFKQKPGTTRKRLKPEDSKFTKEKLITMSCRDLYNNMRCREDPYPNVCIEDETGVLYFKKVGFEPKI